jgi:riboflavin biosynthesis pyrimidine reductase
MTVGPHGQERRMHVIWYTAMSMDGRVAGIDDDLAFLETIDSTGEPESEFPDFIAGIDAVLIGGSTLRWLAAHGHGWPHGDLPTWLLSRDELLLGAIGPVDVPIQQRAGDVGAVLDEIEAAGHERVWLCGGGSVAGQVLQLDRVDEVLVTIAPTALGAGPSLFDQPGLSPRRFRLAEVRRYGSDSIRARWLREASEN